MASRYRSSWRSASCAADAEPATNTLTRGWMRKTSGKMAIP
jgi:hypothetical protein